MTYTVLIPNRYPDIIAPLVQSINTFEPLARVVILGDHHENGYGFEVIRHDIDPFQFAHVVNIGIESFPFSDIILLNDDCVLLGPTFDIILEVANKYPTVGILSPLIKGCAGNPVQRMHEQGKWWAYGEKIKFVWGQRPVCFPCVFLRRSMIRQIGLLDETIEGYGNDDNEYCERARRFDWDTAVTSQVAVQHGDGEADLTKGKTWSLSFSRRKNLYGDLQNNIHRR